MLNKKGLILIILLTAFVKLAAQPNNPPLDGGILWLLIGGIAIGIVTLRKKKNK
jgi:hypothetical protein